MRKEVKINNILIKWLGYASFEISNDLLIYIDPVQLRKPKIADIILITHHHPRHFNKKILSSIMSKGTTIICPYKVYFMLKEVPNVIPVKPGDVITVKNIEIWATPAYNINKFDSDGFPIHPREELNVGYSIYYDDLVIYHTGDTDNILELRGIKCDVLLLPVGGKCVMTVDEAIKAAKTINPEKGVIPMHYDPSELFKGKIEDFIRELSMSGIIVL